MVQGSDSSRESQFYQAAEPLFDRFGFRKTTVEDICKATGSSKRTFYELFKDKGDFFVNLIMYVTALEVTSWFETMDDKLSPREKLESYMDKYVEVGRAHPIFNQCMIEPEVHEVMHRYTKEEKFKPLIDALSKVIAEGVESGEFRRVDPDSMVWIIGALMDSVYYIMPQMTGMPGAYLDETLAAETRAFIINGLLACREGE